ncbi:hypothetical protein MXB_4607, partial [Myxobolus squamalis]
MALSLESKYANFKLLFDFYKDFPFFDDRNNDYSTNIEFILNAVLKLLNKSTHHLHKLLNYLSNSQKLYTDIEDKLCQVEEILSSLYSSSNLSKSKIFLEETTGDIKVKYMKHLHILISQITCDLFNLNNHSIKLIKKIVNFSTLFEHREHPSFVEIWSIDLVKSIVDIFDRNTISIRSLILLHAKNPNLLEISGTKIKDNLLNGYQLNAFNFFIDIKSIFLKNLDFKLPENYPCLCVLLNYILKYMLVHLFNEHIDWVSLFPSEHKRAELSILRIMEKQISKACKAKLSIDLNFCHEDHSYLNVRNITAFIYNFLNKKRANSSMKFIKSDCNLNESPSFSQVRNVAYTPVNVTTTCFKEPNQIDSSLFALEKAYQTHILK